MQVLSTDCKTKVNMSPPFSGLLNYPCSCVCLALFGLELPVCLCCHWYLGALRPSYLEVLQWEYEEANASEGQGGSSGVN